jgi:hypothetical protein
MKEEIYSLWTTGRGLYVLLGLLAFGIFLSPLLIADGLISDILVESVFALILIAGVFATPCSTTSRFSMMLLVVLAVATRVVHKFNRLDDPIAIADNVLAAISLVAFSILIVRHFLIDKVLLRYRIAAAVAVYLIFGVLWARLYEIVYLCNPAAFSLNENINPFSLIYFSFVTLVSLGYGDIVPVSMAARSLAILEGVVGQLYMVILISSLVSEFSALALKPSNDKA